MSLITLMIASPSPLIRRGVMDVARGMQGVATIHPAHSFDTAMQGLIEHAPDVLLLDAQLTQVLHALADAGHRSLRVVVLGTKSHVGAQWPFGPASMCGYVNHQNTMEIVLGRLEMVTNCSVPYPGYAETCDHCPMRRTLELPLLPLSERECEVFTLIGDGYGVSRMADELGLSVKTIEAHRESIKRKLGLGSARALLAASSAWCSGDFLPLADTESANTESANPPPVEPLPRRTRQPS